MDSFPREKKQLPGERLFRETVNPCLSILSSEGFHCLLDALDIRLLRSFLRRRVIPGGYPDDESVHRILDVEGVTEIKSADRDESEQKFRALFVTQIFSDHRTVNIHVEDIVAGIGGKSFDESSQTLVVLTV